MLISEATFIVVDVETTGLDAEADRIVEIAAVATTATEVLGMWSTLVDGRPVTPDNSAIHGLVNADLVGAPVWPTALDRFIAFCGRFGPWTEVRLVGHNAKFDKGFVDPDGQDWLCTKRLAQHLFPATAPGYSNQTLRYWFEDLRATYGEDPYVETFGIAAHRALGDALVTARNLRYMLEQRRLDTAEDETVEQLIEHAQSPVLYQKWPRGKHFGQPIAAAPDSYCDWAVKNICADDPDLKFTLEAHLNQGGML